MVSLPEPHEKRDLRRDDGATAVGAKPAPAGSPAAPMPLSAPADTARRAPLSRRELERLRQSLKAKFH